MKFSLVFALLYPLAVLAVPAEMEAEGELDADAADSPPPRGDPSGGVGTFAVGPGGSGRITCTIRADALKYRKCPDHTKPKKCPAHGQYPRGKRVTFTCAKYGSKVNGWPWWVKGTNGWWSSAYYLRNCTPNDLLPICR